MRHASKEGRRLCFLASPLIVAVLCFGCSQGEINYPDRKVPEMMLSDPKHIQKGQLFFVKKCASCHGKVSEGRSERAAFFNPPAPDFTDIYYKAVDPAYLYWRIDTGKTVEPYRSQGSVMPAWGAHFTEQQIWQMVAYLQSRAH